jgi:small-conductance mechanosensitive channel
MNLESILATITDKVLQKPLLQLPNISITFTNLLFVGLIFLIAYFVHTLFKLLMALQVKRNVIKRAQSKTLSQLAAYVFTILAVAASFSYIGYSLSYFFLGSTALLVGIGFGLQQLFVDLISGVILLIDKNVNYGDVVMIDIPGSSINNSGRIVQIGLRTTQLETIDNQILIVPNSKILSNGLKSLMRSRGAVRFRIDLHVAYNSDMEKVKTLMIKAALSNYNTEKDPVPNIIVKSFDDNGVSVELRFWMKELFNSENHLSEIRFEILKLFRENNIEIPFPQRVVHMK